MTFKHGLNVFHPLGAPVRGDPLNRRRLALCHTCRLDDHRNNCCEYSRLLDFIGPNAPIDAQRTGILAIKAPRSSLPSRNGREARHNNAGPSPGTNSRRG
jgi:hypothetical protein